jgi:hypothetical protein
MRHLVGAVRAWTVGFGFAALGIAAGCAANGTGSDPGTGQEGQQGIGSSTGGSSGSSESDGAAVTGSSSGSEMTGTHPSSSGSGSGSASGSSSGTSSGSGSGSSGGSSSNGGSSSGTSSNGGSSSGSSPGMMPPNLPKVSGTCPTYSNGATVTVTAGSGSLQAQIWMGTKGGGPIIVYWHGTASSPGGEIPIAFDTSAVAAAGGIIIGFNANSRTGATSGDTGDAVWYTSDGVYADQAVACAIQNNHMDPTHIHTAGYSAGGLQTVWMWYARSGYLASVISYSGGSTGLNTAPMQDASNLPSAIVAHGAMGSDDLILDFAQTSATWETAIKQGGGFSIDCNDGGSHLDFFTKRAPGLQPVAFKFFQDHGFGIKPDPYAKGLPSGFPSYCKID